MCVHVNVCVWAGEKAVMGLEGEQAAVHRGPSGSSKSPASGAPRLAPHATLGMLYSLWFMEGCGAKWARTRAAVSGDLVTVSDTQLH